jgi:acyl carrier protein
MNSQEIMHQLNTIFIDIFDNESIVLTPETTASNIEEWDSLNHIQLVIAIERHFKQKFTSSEIKNWKNVGDMCKAIEKNLSTK